MNDRMTELYAKACLDARDIHPTDVPAFIACMAENFAELIVNECVSIVAKRKDQAIDDGWNVDEAMSMAEMDLEEHFGIKA